MINRYGADSSLEALDLRMYNVRCWNGDCYYNRPLAVLSALSVNVYPVDEGIMFVIVSILKLPACINSVSSLQL